MLKKVFAMFARSPELPEAKLTPKEIEEKYMPEADAAEIKKMEDQAFAGLRPKTAGSEQKGENEEEEIDTSSAEVKEAA